MVSLFDREQLTANQQALLDAADQQPQTTQLFPQTTLAYMAGQRLDGSRSWTCCRSWPRR
jgi:hypothetical protein